MLCVWAKLPSSGHVSSSGTCDGCPPARPHTGTADWPRQLQTTDPSPSCSVSANQQPALLHQQARICASAGCTGGLTWLADRCKEVLVDLRSACSSIRPHTAQARSTADLSETGHHQQQDTYIMIKHGSRAGAPRRLGGKGDRSPARQQFPEGCGPRAASRGPHHHHSA